MDEYNTLILLKEYGHIKIKLAEMIDSKAITRNKLSKLAHTRFEVIDHLYNGSTERLDLDILARICFVLNCKVEDIIEFVPE